MSLAYWWLLVILNIIQGFFLKEKFKLNLFDPPHFCFSIILSFQGFIKLATQNALLNPLRLKSYFLQIMGSTWVNTWELVWSGQMFCSMLFILCLVYFLFASLFSPEPWLLPWPQSFPDFYNKTREYFRFSDKTCTISYLKCTLFKKTLLRTSFFLVDLLYSALTLQWRLNTGIFWAQSFW